MRRVYLDYNASTPIDPAVAAAMRPFLEDHYGNPSSGHWAAAPAKAALETARGQVAALLRCRSDEIVFTSGGSEANNLALKGVFFAHRDRGDHIVTTRIEHPAIIEPCAFLERLGARVTYLPVDGTGRIDPDDLRRAITPRTILISIMHANNEVGTIQPIEDCARIAHERDVLFHTDAAQSVGKVATEVDRLGVDLLSIAGHKAYAPKGVGALFVRDGVSIEPLLHGAGHEHGRRAGTESVLLAAGLGKACELGRDLAPMDRVRALRDRFWEALQKQFGNRVRSTDIPPIACRTRSMFHSSVGSVPRYWSGSRVSRPRRDRRVTPAGSSSLRCWRPWVSRPRWAWAPSASVLGVGRRARTSTSLSSVCPTSSSPRDDRSSVITSCPTVARDLRVN
jgi:cysteine desulfurase